MKKLLSVLLVVIFIWSVVPRNLNASNVIEVRKYFDKNQVWFFHYGKKLTWYVMEVNNFILTKIGPPAFKLSKTVSLIIAAGPDFAAEGKKLFKSFVVDMIPKVSTDSFLGVFVNKVGMDKDGKGIYTFRYSLTNKENSYTDLGFRLSGSGIFGEKNKNFQVGPMVRYHLNKKLFVEGWLGVNLHNSEKTVEFVFNIKL